MDGFPMTTTTFTKSALVAALLAMTLAAIALLPAPASAADVTASAPDRPAANSAPDSAASDSDSDRDDAATWDNGHIRFSVRRDRHFGHDSDDLVSVGHDSILAAGGQIDSVVAVFGSATNNGTAREDVVSVFGDTTVNGPVGDSAVAVLGNVTVNAEVAEDVVAVLGSVRLGPAARVHGHVVSILGTVTEDPSAVVDQGIERILPEQLTSSQSLRTWVGKGLMLGRPLVLGTGLSWLWGISFAFLAIYTILALLFRDATEHCIATLNDNPGKSLITAILAVLVTPLMLFLLMISVVGILVIPIALVILFCAALFGKTTALGWIGNRCFNVRPGLTAPHPALAVIVGGLLVMLAYLVPILGLVVFILLGMIGYGAVLYALINRFRRTTSGTPHGAAAAAPNATAPGPASTAAAPGAAAAGAAAQTAPPDAAAAAAPAAPAEQLPLSTYPRAGFWVRMGALLIDTVIICALVRLLLSWPDEESGRLCVLGLAIYGALMWKIKGTTIGGIVFDLRVVRLDSRILDWPTAWVRALGCVLSICALGLGFIWIGVDAGKQAWHDKLAGTIVVRVPKGTPLV
jgi:uncharacterized RDD family membrane protein YckC